ncbi:hypothetical protein SDC9_26643 [bioreactor metagenome]|uniref:Tetratricopeptide repeat protein n=1 Tax=bioreactor metagenome TaxID=1076179 RepID=A0A644UPQ6_9ZZZZ|nr:hypothetical protein [Lentimicrobium sp.]MEA5111124.1 hypothetical protein [Lentimicrobium sp.]
MSGNTFGGIFWSDGSYFAPMLPDLPVFTRCTGCGEILNIFKARHEEAGSWEEADGLPSVGHLSPEDIREALESGRYQDAEEMIYLRRRLWWSMNDHPYGDETPTATEVTGEYRDNAIALMSLLSGESNGDLITKAELYRNLGDYEMCLETLTKINEPSLNTQKVQIEEASRKKISGTIRFNNS